MRKSDTKDKVLNLLKDNKNTYISGQEIADSLAMTRAAVWKAIKSLKENGANIVAVNNKGYCFVENNNSLSSESIYSYLKDTDISLIIRDEVDSTNDVAKSLESEYPSNDFVVISDYQTKGRGRRGRSFYSPKGSGLYMSFLIRPNTEISKATLITCMSAVAVARAISDVCNIETSIKWVNDIYLADKKIAGILTEGVTSMEDGSLSYMIVGIGINITTPIDGFPSDISKIAGTLYKNTAPENIKNMLCAAIIDNFMNLYKSGDMTFTEEYKSRSNLIGHYVKVNPSDDYANLNGYALVKGIDDNCRLLVQYDNGKCEALSNGEVSVVKY